MPAFEQALSDAQINQVIDFVVASEKASGSVKPPIPDSVHTLDYKVSVETVASGLDLPWGIDFLDSGKALITERGGHLRLWQNGTLAPEPVKGHPCCPCRGQEGSWMCPRGLITLRMAGFTCPTVMRKRWMEPTNPMP